MGPTSKSLSKLKRENLDRIIDAVLFAFEAHKHQERKAGGPYIVHPLRVALQALALGERTETIMAAVLHDVIEDTNVSIAEINTRFGKQVGAIVASLTKPSRGTPNRTSIYTEQLVDASRETKLIKILDIEDNLYDAETAFSREKAASYREKQTKLLELLNSR
jgi:GTP pyrophosphokinase